MACGPTIIPAPFEREASDVLNGALSIAARIHQAGHEAYFAGGFVRDRLIGRPTHDIDIATSAPPDDIQALFPGRSRAFGKSFGVIQVEDGDQVYEVATFRKDSFYEDGRRPESIEFTTAENDALRRDFTVNGLFYNPQNHTVIDNVDGLTDIRDRIIRAIGDPAYRFAEDHLRIMRAVRFASVLEFTIEPATLNAIRTAAPSLASISVERIRTELIRTFMEAPDPASALDLLRDTGTIDVILPEISRLAGVEQPPEFHPEGDVYEHVRLMLSLMKHRSPELIWSILLHDIAKPDTFNVGTDRDGNPRIQFRGHAEQGAEMAASIMKRFRCSNHEIEAVSTAVRNHMKFISVPEMKRSTLRRWVGSDTFSLELELHRIDCEASHGKLDHYQFLLNLQEELANEPVLPSPFVSGDDLIEMGIKPGKRLGKLLKSVYDAQLEGTVTTREEALALAKALGSD